MGIQATVPNCPTHKRGNTLDLILSDFVSSCHVKLKSVETDLATSDHYPILFTINNLQFPMLKQNCSKLVKFRKIKNINLESFKSDLELGCSSALTTLDSSTDLSTAVALYNNAIKECLDNHAPLQTKVLKCQDEEPPWFDIEYKKERSIRRKWEKRYKKTKHVNDWNNYRNQSIRCRKMVKFKRKQYYSNSIAEIEGNQKLLFKFVRDKLGSSKNNYQLPSIQQDNQTLANSFSKFFVNKVQSIQDSFTSPQPEVIITSNSHVVGDSSVLSAFEPCTENELRKVIKNAGITVSPADILPSSLTCDSIDVLIPYLTKLVNHSLSTGSFDGLKEAIVKPLYKTDSTDPNDLSNYRPVSNLEFLSKLVERVVLARLQQHMEEINYKNDTQFGYKKLHGTETLLLKLVNDILVGLDSKSGVILVLLDLSAAFDTVNQNKLINILHNELNITGTALKWFRSYLKCRTQRVMVGDCFSDPVVLTFGVPQGSVLGPILFNIYVSSISSVFTSAGFNNLSYADDNSGYQVFTISAENDVFNEWVPNLLNNVSVWMEQYFLKLNEDKTKIIVFGSRQFLSRIEHSSILTRNRINVKFTDQVKYLGVYLDNHMNMKAHMNKITSSCYSTLRCINGIRSFLSQHQCEILINACVTSKIDYCNSLFYNLSRSNCLDKLTKIQRYASKIVFNKNRHQGFPFHVRLDTLHWLSIEKRITFKVLMLVFKCLNNLAPALLSSLLLPYTTGRHADSNILRTNLFYPTSLYGKRAFVYYAPRLWNALPSFIRQISVLSIFKQTLKTYLYNSYETLMQRFHMYRA